MSQLNHPTPYADVNAVLYNFAAHIQKILAGQFLGMYLYGSLALGDFDPLTSDIDFIVVTTNEIADDLYTALQEMHEQFDTGESPWAAKVEAAYIPQEALHSFAPTQAKYPQVEKGTKLFKAPLEIGWAFQLYTLRERGVVIAGPDPHMITSPVYLSSMRQAVAAIAGCWQEQASRDPGWLEWLRHKEAQTFVVLTLCRMLYSLDTGDVVSKPAAARWAKKVLDPHWAAIIDRAIIDRAVIDRSITAQHDQGEELHWDVEDTLAFIQYTVGRSTRSLTEGEL
jgi:hypothetical protein